MSGFRLDMNDLAILRAHLAKTHRILQPLTDHDGNLRWLDAAADAPLPDAALLPAFSPKSLLFAERESLFQFDGSVFRETRVAPLPTVLFGVTACDLAAIHYQDRFFVDDPWYQARRAALVLIGIDCITPCNGGFCPITDSGPFVRDSHADLVLHPPSVEDANHWLLFVATERGAHALEGLKFRHHAARHRNAFMAEREPAVVARFPNDDAMKSGIAALNAHAVSSARWQRLGTECITCSGCSNVCPTCSCFATRQETVNGIAAESNTSASNSALNAAPACVNSAPAATVRFWDSCLYEGFQREASGHNPSAEAGLRIERFWTHKFGDDFVARFGHYTCVGCGRCDRVCPSGIGARTTLTRIGATDTARVANMTTDATVGSGDNISGANNGITPQ